MAKLYRPTAASRLAGRMLTRALRAGRGPRFMRLLTVVGRRTGRSYTTPVVPVVTTNGRWLVSPYGEVNWVRNVRAAETLTLSRGDQLEILTATELDPEQAAPVLREYLAMKPASLFVRAYFDATSGSCNDELIRDARNHPVFELTSLPAADHPGKDTP
jgi:deazaflavin-dependent oxidoreductase (nitroreductase family)